ncbi:MAG TPA: class II fructose-1,6-bisphosphate aldolase [Candidatus Magasanikbacteria bacterium]|nr:class II fructose-1,6-bisphosphate aldolase [Candidatus Magasanikbacteria bacterium]
MFLYQKFGFVNTKDLFKKAMKGHYALPAYNFNNMEQLQAIVEACLLTQSPVILQVSKGAREYADSTMLQYMAQGAVEMIKRIAREKKLKNIPIVLHLDHGADFEICKSAILSGFSSVMIDGSYLPYKENIKLTKKVVDFAHKYGVSVEGELGVLSGVEDEVKSEVSNYTKPEEVVDFVKKTGVDSLAISIGTSHGAYKFKPGVEPKIRLDILAKIEKQLPNFPIVLHGSSSVPQEYVNIANKNGAKLEKAIGIPEKQLRLASKSAVCKINVDTDGRLVMTAMIRLFLNNKREEIDPRKYLGLAREELKKMYMRKNKEVFGSNGRV